MLCVSHDLCDCVAHAELDLVLVAGYMPVYFVSDVIVYAHVCEQDGGKNTWMR